ncbi:hypothetical protein SAMN04488117_102286 [Celeribacter baekdonensis]|uniref:ABM domain-containing protein n=1 Tax=Celeribacter baekdonensis TaxID=875171 RepID=A0A1G7IDG5_9RHOB|nr:hypothetical protein [Celeribacter baekdonensis]SDF10751.1 hypothetical protein SAMN04488117_102286 [Celeribacter baekdonensis]
MSDIQIIETVTFRTIAGVSDSDLTAVAKGLNAYLDRCEGFRARTLYKDASGLWHEHYVWANDAAAKAADAGFMAAPEAQAFMALVDRDTVSMGHAPITLARIISPEAA